MSEVNIRVCHCSLLTSCVLYTRTRTSRRHPQTFTYCTYTIIHICRVHWEFVPDPLHTYLALPLLPHCQPASASMSSCYCILVYLHSLHVYLPLPHCLYVTTSVSACHGLLVPLPLTPCLPATASVPICLCLLAYMPLPPFLPANPPVVYLSLHPCLPTTASL
jgi:hypothetical protein